MFEDIQIIALAAVEDQTWEYATRNACRKYSEVFHTPLRDVDDLPITYILQHLFEHMFENMTADGRAVFASRLAMTEGEKDSADARADEDDAWSAEEAAAEAAKNAAVKSAAPEPMALPEASLSFDDLPPDRG